MLSVDKAMLGLLDSLRNMSIATKRP